MAAVLRGPSPPGLGSAEGDPPPSLPGLVGGPGAGGGTTGLGAGSTGIRFGGPNGRGLPDGPEVGGGAGLTSLGGAAAAGAACCGFVLMVDGRLRAGAAVRFRAGAGVRFLAATGALFLLVAGVLART